MESERSSYMDERKKLLFTLTRFLEKIVTKGQILNALDTIFKNMIYLWKHI